MASNIIVYNARGEPLRQMHKGAAHAEMESAHRAEKAPPHRHRHLGVLLMNSDGELMPSIRSPTADTNPDMIDKSLGGHVPAGFNQETALLEVACREFHIPLAIVTKEELETVVRRHAKLLERQAFVTHLDFRSDFASQRAVLNGKAWDEHCMQDFYIGVYNGKNRTSEGNGMRTMSLGNLEKYTAAFKERATGDLRFMLGEYPRIINELQGIVLDTKISRESGSENTVELLAETDARGVFIGPADRKRVHGPIIESYKAGRPQERKHSHIGGLLVGKNGEIYVQIRSPTKSENPGMYDKLVGGHIPLGDTPVLASYHELGEEMSIPSIFCNADKMANILTHFPNITSLQAVCCEPMYIPNYVSERIRTDGNSFKEVCDQYFFFGLYDGEFRFVDKESAGLFQFPNLAALHAEMAREPGKFTDDLKYMVRLFEHELVPRKNL